MAAKKINDTIRDTIKAQIFVYELESFVYEKMHSPTFWEDEDAEDTLKRERDAVFGHTTDVKFEDCEISELRAYAGYLSESSGIPWDEFHDFSFWPIAWIDMFQKLKGKFSGKGEKMTASEIKKHAAAKKTPAKKPSAKKPSAKKASAKKTPAKKTPAKKAVTKSVAVKKELAAKKVAEKKAAPKKAAPKGTPTKKSSAKAPPKSPATKKVDGDAKIREINKRNEKKAA